MAQDPSSDQGTSEPHTNHPQDPAARGWKQPASPPRVYPALDELLLPPPTVRISFVLWLVAALPVAIMMGMYTATYSARSSVQPGDSLTIRIVVAAIVSFAILSIFPVKMMAGRQWARVWLIVVCVLWTLLWLGGPFSRPLGSSDDSVVVLVINIVIGGTVMIMICASILMFLRPSAEYFREVGSGK